MKPIRIAVILLSFTFGLALRSMVTTIHAQSTTVVVTIQNYAFSPAVITLPAGTTVVWSNKDSVDHAPTSDTNAWDAGIVGAGTNSSGTAFNSPGTYPYHCAIHPEMTGTIVVTGSGSGPTPTPTVRVAPTATATPVATSVPTSTPVPNLGSTTVPTATATPLPTATSTPLPLVVKVAIGHKTVKAGAKQSIKVTTLAGAAITIVVTFPDGTKMHRTGTASGSGTFTWTFNQPGRHTTRTKHTAKVAVTVSHGAGSPIKSTKSYTIR